MTGHLAARRPQGLYWKDMLTRKVPRHKVFGTQSTSSRISSPQSLLRHAELRFLPELLVTRSSSSQVLRHAQYIQPEFIVTISSARRVHPAGVSRHNLFGTQSTSSRSFSSQSLRHAEYIQSELLATISSARRAAIPPWITSSWSSSSQSKEGCATTHDRVTTSRTTSTRSTVARE